MVIFQNVLMVALGCCVNTSVTVATLLMCVIKRRVIAAQAVRRDGQDQTVIQVPSTGLSKAYTALYCPHICISALLWLVRLDCHLVVYDAGFLSCSMVAVHCTGTVPYSYSCIYCTMCLAGTRLSCMLMATLS